MWMWNCCEGEIEKTQLNASTHITRVIFHVYTLVDAAFSFYNIYLPSDTLTMHLFTIPSHHIWCSCCNGDVELRAKSARSTRFSHQQSSVFLSRCWIGSVELRSLKSSNLRDSCWSRWFNIFHGWRLSWIQNMFFFTLTWIPLTSEVVEDEGWVSNFSFSWFQFQSSNILYCGCNGERKLSSTPAENWCRKRNKEEKNWNWNWHYRVEKRQKWKEKSKRKLEKSSPLWTPNSSRS